MAHKRPYGCGSGTPTLEAGATNLSVIISLAVKAMTLPNPNEVTIPTLGQDDGTDSAVRHNIVTPSSDCGCAKKQPVLHTKIAQALAPNQSGTPQGAPTQPE